MKAFEQNVIILTGASSGIGLAFAELVAPQKPIIVMVARDETKLVDAAKKVGALGAQTVAIAGDLSEKSFCKQVVDQTIERFGRIDTLINNAGITLWANFEDTADLSLSDKIMNINYNSVLYMTHYALPHIKKSNGRLAAVSSISGFMGVPGHAVYSASKHAIHGLYDSLRLELNGTEVSVTLIAPDFIQTEIHYRGLDANGNPMKKRLSGDVAMSAQDCASIILKGLTRRERLINTSTRGKFAYPMRGLVPTILDAFALKSRNKHNLVD